MTKKDDDEEDNEETEGDEREEPEVADSSSAQNTATELHAMQLTLKPTRSVDLSKEFPIVVSDHDDEVPFAGLMNGGLTSNPMAEMMV